jgi:hypothetical protein
MSTAEREGNICKIVADVDRKSVVLSERKSTPFAILPLYLSKSILNESKTFDSETLD